MGRSKMQLKLIENERRRTACFAKRKTGLKKKAFELSTLCNIPAFLICVGPRGRVETWPEDEQAVRDIIARYRSISGDKTKNQFDLQGYLESQVRRLRAELERRQTNDGFAPWDQRLDGMPEEALRELSRSLDSRAKAVEDRIESLKQQGLFSKEIVAVPCRQVQLHCSPNYLASTAIPTYKYSNDPSMPSTSYGGEIIAMQEDNMMNPMSIYTQDLQDYVLCNPNSQVGMFNQQLLMPGNPNLFEPNVSMSLYNNQSMDLSSFAPHCNGVFFDQNGLSSSNFSYFPARVPYPMVAGDEGFFGGVDMNQGYTAAMELAQNNVFHGPVA